jgi:1,4-alpha-glucan branching enzyme
MSTTAELHPDSPDLLVVTFHLPAHVNANTVCVVGEFNGWSQTATPMRATVDGFEATTMLPYGRAYRFRYLIDGHRWENDWAADGYVANEYGGDDSVVDLTTKPVSDSTDPGRSSGPVPRRRASNARKTPKPVRIWQ